MNSTKISEADHLLLNLSSGLLPENLSQREVGLLREKYGSNWFEELGYSEPNFKRPVWS